MRGVCWDFGCARYTIERSEIDKRRHKERNEVIEPGQMRPMSAR